MAFYDNPSLQQEYDQMAMSTFALADVQPYLRCLKGLLAGYDIPIPATGMLIGRDPVACQLVFDQDPEVSRYHCRASYNRHSGFFIITDLRSTNGVFTQGGNRLPPGEKLALSDGQQFALCGGKIVFQALLKRE